MSAEILRAKRCLLVSEWRRSLVAMREEQCSDRPSRLRAFLHLLAGIMISAALVALVFWQVDGDAGRGFILGAIALSLWLGKTVYERWPA